MSQVGNVHVSHVIHAGPSQPCISFDARVCKSCWTSHASHVGYVSLFSRIVPLTSVSCDSGFLKGGCHGHLDTIVQVPTLKNQYPKKQVAK